MAQAKTRTCVACATSGDKATLVRIVRGADGEVSVDPSGRAPGRGAYVCRSQACFDAAMRKHAFDRALRVRLDDAARERLVREFGMLCVEHSDAQ